MRGRLRTRCPQTNRSIPFIPSFNHREEPMQSDSIDTLLLRQYGSTAPTPADLEEQLKASVHRKAAELHKQQQIAASWQQRRISRRQILRVVTMGATGAGILSI